MYSINAVFHTDCGPRPGFSFAPSHTPGVFELTTPVMLYDGKKGHAVSAVRIHKAAPTVIMSSQRGWLSVPDLIDVGTEVAAQSDCPMRVYPNVGDPVEDAVVNECALLAALHLSGVAVDRANRLIGQLVVGDIRTKRYEPADYRLGRRPLLPYTALTEDQYKLFLYMVLTVAHRIGSVRADKTTGTVRYRVRPIHWRDLIMTQLISYGMRPTAKYFSNGDMLISVDAPLFLRFTNDVISNGIAGNKRDFRLLSRAAIHQGLLVEENGVVTLADESADDVDNSALRSLEIVQSSMHPYTGPAISFPEIQDVILKQNGLCVL